MCAFFIILKCVIEVQEALKSIVVGGEQSWRREVYKTIDDMIGKTKCLF
jgi:hypothetical protein